MKEEKAETLRKTGWHIWDCTIEMHTYVRMNLPSRGSKVCKNPLGKTVEVLKGIKYSSLGEEYKIGGSFTYTLLFNNVFKIQ